MGEGSPLLFTPPNLPLLPLKRSPSAHRPWGTQRHLTSQEKITAPGQPWAGLLAVMEWEGEKILTSLTSPAHQDSRADDNGGISFSPPDHEGWWEVRMGGGKGEEVTRAAGAGRRKPPEWHQSARLRHLFSSAYRSLLAHNHFWSALYGSAVSCPILQKRKLRLQLRMSQGVKHLTQGLPAGAKVQT